jgi:hypothetical protein
MKRFLQVSAIALSLTLCLASGQTLSLVDDDIPPAVEVIHNDNWNKRIEPHEWRVLMLPEGQAFAVEEGLSKLWNEYDARIYWRIGTDINSLAYVPNCLVGLTNFDFLLGAWDGKFFATLDSSLFCDGLGLQWPTYLIGLCGVGDGTLWTDWGRIQSNYANAVVHGVTNYYPDYFKKALGVIGKNMPTALNWGFPGIALPGQPTGVVLQPIFGTPQPAMYVKLAQRAQNIDVRGAAYIMQNYPLNVLPRDLLKQVLRWLPGDKIDPSMPGLEDVEALKRGLTTRTGTFDLPLQWATPAFLGSGPKPTGETGASTPIEMAGVGHQVFFNVQSRFITEVSPRVPLLWRACFDLGSGATIPFPTPLPPVVHAIPRLESFWDSVPEGRAIPEVKGIPSSYGVVFAPLAKP